MKSSFLLKWFKIWFVCFVFFYFQVNGLTKLEAVLLTQFAYFIISFLHSDMCVFVYLCSYFGVIWSTRLEAELLTQFAIFLILVSIFVISITNSNVYIKIKIKTYIGYSYVPTMCNFLDCWSKLLVMVLIFAISVLDMTQKHPIR